MWGRSLNDMYGLELWLAAKAGLLKRKRGAYRYHKFEQAYTDAYIYKMWKATTDSPFPNEVILK